MDRASDHRSCGTHSAVDLTVSATVQYVQQKEGALIMQPWLAATR